MSLKPEGIAAAIVASPELQTLLPRFNLPDIHQQFVTLIGTSTGEVRAFFECYDSNGRIPKACKLKGEEIALLRGLIKSLKHNISIHRAQRNELFGLLRLSNTVQPALKQLLSCLPAYHLDRLRCPMPPSRHWIFEDPIHRQKYEKWLATNPWTPDKRVNTRSYPFFHVRDSDLQLDLKHDESALVYDSKTGELILFVFAGVIQAPHILDWMTRVIERGCEALRSVRLSDPGKLAIAGYSAGSRSEACLGWSSTLATGDMAKVFRKKESGALDQFNCDISNVFSLTWNIFKKIAPTEVLQDYVDTVKLYDLPLMDANGKQKKFFEIPGFSKEEGFHRLHLADKAPVGGLIGKNYVRYVHTETNLTRYMNSFTTCRSQDSSKGGHFYLCQYGIRVQGGGNKWVTWKPTDAHGTSLQDVDYGDANPTDFKQVGLGTSLSSRLPAAIFGAYMKMAWNSENDIE